MVNNELANCPTVPLSYQEKGHGRVYNFIHMLQYLLVLALICNNYMSAKTIILVRHGVTEMNEYLSRNNWGSPGFVDCGLWDTRLSRNGLALCLKINDALTNKMESSDAIIMAYRNHIEKLVEPSEKLLVYSSPLTRALQTSELIFKNIKVDSVSFSVQPLLTERLYMSSDVGRLKEELRNEFPRWDLSTIADSERWWYETKKGDIYKEWRPAGRYLCNGEPEDVFRERMVALRRWIVDLPETLVVLVTHWGVIRSLTGLSFDNCEARAFHPEDLLHEPFIDK